MGLSIVVPASQRGVDPSHPPLARLLLSTSCADGANTAVYSFFMPDLRNVHVSWRGVDLSIVPLNNTVLALAQLLTDPEVTFVAARMAMAKKALKRGYNISMGDRSERLVDIQLAIKAAVVSSSPTTHALSTLVSAVLHERYPLPREPERLLVDWGCVKQLSEQQRALVINEPAACIRLFSALEGSDEGGRDKIAAALQLAARQSHVEAAPGAAATSPATGTGGNAAMPDPEAARTSDAAAAGASRSDARDSDSAAAAQPDPCRGHVHQGPPAAEGGTGADHETLPVEDGAQARAGESPRARSSADPPPRESDIASDADLQALGISRLELEAELNTLGITFPELVAELQALGVTFRELLQLRQAEQDLLSRKRIKLDIFHLMQRIARGCRSQRSRLFATFLRVLKAAFFVTNADDLKEVKEWLRVRKGMGEDEIKALPSRYFDRFVRRKVPPPGRLALNLAHVYIMFKDVVEKENDGGPDLPFYRRDMAKIFKDAMVHVLNGCVSDPPSMPMYTARPGPEGRLVYKSLRGTDDLENFHLWVRRMLLHGHNMSPEVRMRVRDPVIAIVKPRVWD